MKSTILTLIVLASVFATLITHSQTQQDNHEHVVEEEGVDVPRMIRVQAEFIEMPHTTYTRLMAKPRTSANDADLRAECAKLIEKEEAHIIDTMCVTGLPGQSATTESISEYIYPTEYEPGELPLEINGEEPPLNSSYGSPPLASSFDTKNIGSTFEVEASCDQASRIVEVRFTPTLVYQGDLQNWGAEKVSGPAGPILMPEFYVLKAVTGAVVVSGQPTMISTHTPKNTDGKYDPSRKIMLFLRADILDVRE